MDPKRLLIFPAGTEIAFEIFNALKFSKFVDIYGGTSADDHSGFVYKKLITGFPFVDDPGFVVFLNKVIAEHHIDCIFPAHDSASVVLSRHADEINAQIIMTDYETVQLCRSKTATYEFFRGETFVPHTYEKAEDVERFPVFVKPTVGQGSNGARKINSPEELQRALLSDDTLVISEYLPGMEYTVDCFTDRHGKLRVVKFRDRARIKTGISVRSRQLPVDEGIMEIAERINEKLTFRGAWFFQVKKNTEGASRLMEISPRVPGTMGLSRNMGINFPMLTLFDFWGYDVDIIDNGYDIVLDRAFYSAYQIEMEYDHVYVDFDDTLILDDRMVNTVLMHFLYQAVNEGKQIHLISKHDTDIYEDLKRFRISKKLFDEIRVIPRTEEKADYIVEKPAIFIDDSFAERKKVREALGIPVFDVDMVESLLDRKM